MFSVTLAAPPAAFASALRALVAYTEATKCVAFDFAPGTGLTLSAAYPNVCVAHAAFPRALFAHWPADRGAASCFVASHEVEALLKSLPASALGGARGGGGGAAADAAAPRLTMQLHAGALHFHVYPAHVDARHPVARSAAPGISVRLGTVDAGEVAVTMDAPDGGAIGAALSAPCYVLGAALDTNAWCEALAAVEGRGCAQCCFALTPAAAGGALLSVRGLSSTNGDAVLCNVPCANVSPAPTAAAAAAAAPDATRVRYQLSLLRLSDALRSRAPRVQLAMARDAYVRLRFEPPLPDAAAAAAEQWHVHVYVTSQLDDNDGEDA